MYPKTSVHPTKPPGLPMAPALFLPASTSASSPGARWVTARLGAVSTSGNLKSSNSTVPSAEPGAPEGH